MKKTLLFFILLFALFLRVYRLPELMNFGGDVARDFLTARDISLKKVFPLVGCPSSVPWLHQGSLFIYILGILLPLGSFNPLIVGYFAAITGTTGVFAVYYFGKRLLSEEAGLMSAFIYSTSPLVVIFDRYPYHQNPISLLTVLFFLNIYFMLKAKKKSVLFSFLLMGLLLQFELSNLVLLPVLASVLIFKRKDISFGSLIISILLFFLTWLPKIIFDLKNGFTQTIGFAAWVFHKLIPIKIPGDIISERVLFIDKLRSIILEMSKIVLWDLPFVSGFILFTIFGLFIFLILDFNKKNLSFFFFLKDFLKNSQNLVFFLWIFFPFLGFLLHGNFSRAYLPVIFPLFPLLTGFLIFKLKNNFFKTFIILFFSLISVYNFFFSIKNNYFVLSKDLDKDRSLDNAQGYSLFLSMSNYIVNSADEEFNLVSLGAFSEFKSNIDTFKYLTWYLGRPDNEKKSPLKYFILYNFDRDNYSFLDNEEIKIFPYMTVVKTKTKK